MRFIIEFDGPVFDPASVCYAAHRAAADDVHWSRLEQAAFWRLLRTRGRQADFLPGAKPVKIAEYQRRFDVHLESDPLVATYQPQPGTHDSLGYLGRMGRCSLITLGPNVSGRRPVMEKHGLAGFFTGFDRLEEDPRRRAAALRNQCEADRRSLVVGASDSLIRSAVDAGVFSVAIAGGACSVARLHRAGASVVYRALPELIIAFREGAADFVRAGLLPGALDARVHD